MIIEPDVTDTPPIDHGQYADVMDFAWKLVRIIENRSLHDTLFRTEALSASLPLAEALERMDQAREGEAVEAALNGPPT